MELEPIRQAMREYFGSYSAGVAAGLALRHDHGSVYLSDHFQTELQFLGITSSPAFVREPAGNGCIERFFRTLKENLPWVESDSAGGGAVVCRDAAHIAALPVLGGSSWSQDPAENLTFDLRQRDNPASQRESTTKEGSVVDLIFPGCGRQFLWAKRRGARAH